MLDSLRGRGNVSGVAQAGFPFVFHVKWQATSTKEMHLRFVEGWFSPNFRRSRYYLRVTAKGTLLPTDPET